MRSNGQMVASVGIAVAVATALVTPKAWADSQQPLGGGAGIVVDGNPGTLATIGHDNAGELVGVTSGH
jgi:hypothetical protein